MIIERLRGVKKLVADANMAFLLLKLQRLRFYSMVFWPYPCQFLLRHAMLKYLELPCVLHLRDYIEKCYNQFHRSPQLYLYVQLP